MKVLLLQDVPKVGRKHEIKEVADGFARNVLISKGKAVVATGEALARAEKEKERNAEAGRLAEEAFSAAVTKLAETPIVIKAKADPAGHLFAGIHKEALIAEAERQAGCKLPVESVMLDKPLKLLGAFEVPLIWHKQKGVLKVEIVN